MPEEATDLTQITVYLKRLSRGDESAEAPLADAVYAQIRATARGIVQSGNDDATLEATSLVNIVLLELLRLRSIEWSDRVHFFRTASRMMRRRFIDHIRARRAEKRPPRSFQADYDELLLPCEERFDEIMDVDRALGDLQTFDTELAELVELVYFGGCPIKTISEIRGCSTKTVRRHLDLAQQWLKCRLTLTSMAI